MSPPLFGLLLSFACAAASPRAAAPASLAPPSPALRGKGAIVVWKDETLKPASDPEHLALVLRKAGYGVTLLGRSEMTDPRLLAADRCDLVVLPYGPCYPVGQRDAIAAFLRKGGSLLTLGGPCLRDPVYARGVESNAPPPRAIAAFSADLVSRLKPAPGPKDEPARLSLAPGPAQTPALAVDTPDLQGYQYVRLPTEGSPNHDVLHFCARGDAATEFLCLEMIESDASRWKTVVGLSTEWQTYDVPARTFVSYASKERGGLGDRLRTGQVRNIALGFPASLAGNGPRRFEIANLEWRASGAPAGATSHPPLLFDAHADLRRAFGSQLKLPRPGDVTLFHKAPAFRGASLTTAPGQPLLGPGLTVGGPASGWVTTVLEDDLLLLKARSPRRREFLPSARLVRTIPLLVTPDGLPAAALFLHLGGPYAGSRWAAFGVAAPDVFAPGNAAADAALASVVDAVLHQGLLARLEPAFVVRDGKVRMAVQAQVSAPRAGRAAGKLHARLDSASNSRPAAEAVVPVDVAAGQTQSVVALEVDDGRFDAKDYRIECEFQTAGQRADRLSTSVDVRATLLALCDRLVRTQAERNDGKFSGIGFVDNRGARGLLAAYAITGDKRYLNAALRWGRAIVAEQRSDGGYLMGYGYHEEGNECFVADGGEIACGIARLVTDAPAAEKKCFLASLRAYMGYRESFRCPGGGIGVGWCKTDYGKRPTERLDKINKIYAPEINIYTIGCTLAAATMYARLSGDARDNDAAVRDARWLMTRCEQTVTGAFVESMIWAHKFLRDAQIQDEIEAFLRKTFLPHVTPPTATWWRGGGGRNVQALDGLAYCDAAIGRDPAVRAALLRAAWHVVSPQSVCGIPRVLAHDDLTSPEWFYLNFAAVTLPELIQPEIVRKGF